MAVGDAVIVFSSDNAELIFQPAAGVVVLITSCAGATGGFQVFNGTDFARIIGTLDAAPTSNQSNVKVFVDNTNHIRVDAQGAGNHSAISGITTE